jgi:hypothetical protein
MPERGLCRLERQKLKFSFSSDEKVNVSTRFLNLLLLLVLVFALQQKKRNYTSGPACAKVDVELWTNNCWEETSNLFVP